MTRDEVAAVVPPEVLKRFAAGPYACGSVHPAMFGLLFAHRVVEVLEVVDATQVQIALWHQYAGAARHTFVFPLVGELAKTLVGSMCAGTLNISLGDGDGEKTMVMPSSLSHDGVIPTRVWDGIDGRTLMDDMLFWTHRVVLSKHDDDHRMLRCASNLLDTVAAELALKSLAAASPKLH
jgi:hypothetical protein